MYKKLFVSQDGMSLIIVIFLFLIAVIVSFSLIMRQSRDVAFHTMQEGADKAVQLADTGIEIAIGNLLIDPTYRREPADNYQAGAAARDSWHQPVDKQLDGKGEIIFTVNDSEEAGRVVIISSGIYTSGKINYKRAVKAILEVESPGEYFCASVTNFIVGDGAEMNQGKGIIYGNIVEFLGGATASKVYRAQYTSQCIPGDPETARYTVFEDDDTPPNTPEPVAAGPPYTYPPQPEEVPSKMLPVISDELMERYKKIGVTISSPFSGNLVLTAGATVRFCDGDFTIQDMKYDFQNSTGSVIAVNGNLIIQGDIKNNHNINANKKYGLAFVVKGSVIIETVSSSNLEIQKVLFIATNGKFTVDTTLGKGDTLEFSGAALFRDSFDIKRGFEDRKYTYDPVVKDIENLPFMVNMISYRPIVN